MMLNQNPQMVQMMEDDLKAKIQSAIDCNPALNMSVYGVFNLDDLEKKMESELGGGIGVGVQFSRTQKAAEGMGSNAGRGNAMSMLAFSFSVILAVPAELDSDQRHPATELLSTLRLAIIGKPITGDRVQRTWDFVFEQPEPGASTQTMLYYSQLWQVAMPVGSVA